MLERRGGLDLKTLAVVFSYQLCSRSLSLPMCAIEAK
jgi:hypothetical protein